MAKPEQIKIFFKGSKTYFVSSLFFPKNIRDDIFSLYSFVRRADDFVDDIQKQDVLGLKKFINNFNKCYSGKVVDDEIVQSFVELIKRKKINKKWVDSFFSAMESDIRVKTYKTRYDLEKYIYGSAEVIGLMIARILDLPEDSFDYAKSLGKAMQYANFIRDINEDLGLNRVYMPSTDMNIYGISSLKYEDVLKENTKFDNFIRYEISIYRKYLEYAKKGFNQIPKRYLIPIKTASEMYEWTMNEIIKNPLVIYKKKVKPSYMRVVSRGLINYIKS